MMRMTTLTGGIFLLCMMANAAQAAYSFHDVREDHLAFRAVMDLAQRGIISGYSDGSFRPDQHVTRAEAVKVIVAPFLLNEHERKGARSGYGDVSADAWYAPFIEHAWRIGIVDPPSARPSFEPDRPVQLVEFLKILLSAYRVDAHTSYGDLVFSLSEDVSDTTVWYYPYLRYTLSASVIQADANGLLHPGRVLTRADMALLLDQFLLYREGKRTQHLLDAVQTEQTGLLGMLNDGETTKAQFAAARALLYARGAHFAQPDSSITQGTVKVAEAMVFLSDAYAAMEQEQYEEAVALCGNAWKKSADARERDASLTALAEHIQDVAHLIAHRARERLK